MMNVYTIGMAGTLLTMYLLNAIKNESLRKKILLWLFILFWGSLMAFRAFSVGTDTFNYAVRIFPRIVTNRLTDLNEFTRMPIYTIYNKIVGVISTDPHTIVIFTSYIFVIGVTVFLYFNSENFSMSCFYYLSIAYYFWAMNAARQSLATMLVLWAYHFMKRKMMFPSIFMIILAIGTHATAIVGVIIIFLSFINMNRAKSLLAIVITFALTFLLDTSFVLFVRLFPSYAGYLDPSGIFSAYETSEGNRAYVALVFLAIFGFCYYWKQHKKIAFEDESEFWTLFTLSMIGIEFMTILRHNYTAARVEYYFTYFFMLFLPMCIERFFNKKSKYIAYGGTNAILLILFYIRIQPYLPYVLWE